MNIYIAFPLTNEERELINAIKWPGETWIWLSRSGTSTLANLDELLPHSDVVVGALPDTEETKGLFDTHRLALMKTTAIFVNVGRGTLVDEEALARVLQEKKLAGAVLDVTSIEPLPADHPLWDCPGALLTQHTGGGYADENADKVRFFIQNLQRFRSGDTLRNVVDFSKGY